MFYSSSRSWCLNDKAQNKATVVYKEIGPRSISDDIKFDTPEVRTARDTTKLIDLKKFNQGKQLEKFPGETMSADDQCALQYGKNFRQCYIKAVTVFLHWYQIIQGVLMLPLPFHCRVTAVTCGVHRTEHHVILILPLSQTELPVEADR